MIWGFEFRFFNVEFNFIIVYYVDGNYVFFEGILIEVIEYWYFFFY